VITAAPGAGKTTRVPPALAETGRVLLLQPRRVAARSIARRIAEERHWTAGREVGWHVRFERRFERDTRLLVATEGILTARLQQDPLLSDFQTVVIDEFHERSIHADLGLALAKQAWLARSDLRLVVMSATIDASQVSRYLGGCPAIDVPGRQFPVDVRYRPATPLEDAIRDEALQADGAVLCFLPGAPEIRRAMDRLSVLLGSAVPVLPLHGGLDAEAQDAALLPSSSTRVILATNLAETTVTVPDVRVIVDTGQQKEARYDAARGIDSLELGRVSQDSADQRAGRAGRLAPGRAVRLWDSRDRLRPHREPEIARVDLASVVLDVIAWGGDPTVFDWFESPPPSALDAATKLLVQLGALTAAGVLTPLGADLRRLPLHPRLARLFLAARGARSAALACALLSERALQPRQVTAATTRCDILAAVERGSSLPQHVRHVANDLSRAARDRVGDAYAESVDETTFRRAVLAAYPDRVAKRRAPRSDRFVLATGTGGRLGNESGVRDGDYVAVVDVIAGRMTPANPSGEAIIRMATRVEPEWLEPTSAADEHEIDDNGHVRAWRVDRYGELVLQRHQIQPDADVSNRLVVAFLLARGADADDQQWLRRLRFAGIGTSHAALVEQAASGCTRADEVRIASGLAPDQRAALAHHAPEDWLLPSGRRARLLYEEDGRIVSAVKLQELFGLADSPRFGPDGVPLTIELLAPNGRPVQVTRDLRSFWNGAYQDVRRELRARYPKHPWPEDPWSAPPTHRTTRRGSKSG